MSKYMSARLAQRNSFNARGLTRHQMKKRLRRIDYEIRGIRAPEEKALQLINIERTKWNSILIIQILLTINEVKSLLASSILYYNYGIRRVCIYRRYEWNVQSPTTNKHGTSNDNHMQKISMSSIFAMKLTFSLEFFKITTCVMRKVSWY